MPQMSPLNWLLLFIYFIMILILISIINYYITIYNPTLFLKNKFSQKSLYWKW
uniref:ATP synthase complex subunit 8 n=1 Tax=Italochrysa insignis TaxID=373786 RepID=A0A343ISK6_9NEOP|nr:ATP synthase F0 subunit 8 [Italochrysa insignis]